MAVWNLFSAKQSEAGKKERGCSSISNKSAATLDECEMQETPRSELSADGLLRLSMTSGLRQHASQTQKLLALLRATLLPA
jgi:hypothetical protein